MATQSNQQRMSVEEFFEVCRKHPEGRFEYIHGYVYRLMAGGDSNHSLTKVNLNRELSNALLGGRILSMILICMSGLQMTCSFFQTLLSAVTSAIMES